MNPSSSIRDNSFSMCFAKLQSGNLKLLSPSFSRPISDYYMSLEKWVESSVHMYTLIEATSFALDSNILKLVVDVCS